MRVMPRSVLVLLATAACLTCRTAPKPAAPPAPSQAAKPVADASAPVQREVAPLEKLDPALRELVGSGLVTKEAMAAWAAKHSVKATEKSVPVDVTCKASADVPAVIAAMKASGGRVKSTFRNVIFGSVAESSIERLASMSEVWTMALTQPTFHPIKLSQPGQR